MDALELAGREEEVLEKLRVPLELTLHLASCLSSRCILSVRLWRVHSIASTTAGWKMRRRGGEREATRVVDEIRSHTERGWGGSILEIQRRPRSGGRSSRHVVGTETEPGWSRPEQRRARASRRTVSPCSEPCVTASAHAAMVFCTSAIFASIWPSLPTNSGSKRTSGAGAGAAGSADARRRVAVRAPSRGAARERRRARSARPGAMTRVGRPERAAMVRPLSARGFAVGRAEVRPEFGDVNLEGCRGAARRPLRSD